MQIVETVKKTYLAMEVEEGDASTRLKKSVAVDLNLTNEAIAKAYVKGSILGRVIDVTVKNQNIESIQEADEIGPLTDLMMKYLPLAEKNARANAVLAVLDNLMGGRSEDED